MYVADGDDLIVVPANAGAPRAPGWWLNLTAAGQGIVVIGSERRPVLPIEAADAERARLWALVAAVSPLDHYQRLTERRFPVVILGRCPLLGTVPTGRLPRVAPASAGGRVRGAWG